MTIRELMTRPDYYEAYGDMDVFNDCIDEDAPAWCGQCLTDEGVAHYTELYAPLLDTEVEIGQNMYGYFIDVKINDCSDYNKRWRAVCKLFADAAGYCDEDEYEAWFAESYDPLTGSSDEDSLERIDRLVDMVENAVDWIVDHAAKEDLLPALRKIGLTEERISKIIG